jgi:hypothetical protein
VNIFDKLDAHMEAKEPGYLAKRRREREERECARQARVAELIAHYGSVEAVLAPCERETVLLEAVKPWRVACDPPTQRWHEHLMAVPSPRFGRRFPFRRRLLRLASNSTIGAAGKTNSWMSSLMTRSGSTLLRNVACALLSSSLNAISRSRRPPISWNASAYTLIENSMTTKWRSGFSATSNASLPVRRALPRPHNCPTLPRRYYLNLPQRRSKWIWQASVTRPDSRRVGVAGLDRGQRGLRNRPRNHAQELGEFLL